MADTDIRQLIDSLKGMLKKQKLTYKELAQEINISEASVKRIFSKYDCTLSRLNEICRALNTSILAVSELAIKENQNQNYFLSHEQEDYFSQNPFSFYVFKEIRRGKSYSQLLEEFELQEIDFLKIINKLEKLNMIELHPNNKIKVTIQGQVRLNLDGKFFEKILKPQNLKFLNTVYENIKREDCCFQSSEVRLSKATYTSMVHDINMLGKKYRERAHLESKTIASENLFDIRWLFAFLPYKTDWKEYRN